ncbi:hypothetical protein DMENIID0001_144780 [Sergentomyia squamirostris]
MKRDGRRFGECRLVHFASWLRCANTDFPTKFHKNSSICHFCKGWVGASGSLERDHRTTGKYIRMMGHQIVPETFTHSEKVAKTLGKFASQTTKIISESNHVKK